MTLGAFLNPLGKVGDSPKSSRAVLISSPTFRRLSKLQRWLKLGDSRGLGSAHANYD